MIIHTYVCDFVIVSITVYQIGYFEDDATSCVMYCMASRVYNRLAYYKLYIDSMSHNFCELKMKTKSS